MKSMLFLVFAVILLAACTANISEQQSVQDILNNTKSYEDVINKTINATAEANETAAVNETELQDMTFRVNKKCKNSAIFYDGCKWTDGEKTDFVLKIISAGRSSIPGVWFIITAESGKVKTEKMPGEILSQGRKSYDIDYKSLFDELGSINKFEVYPIEISGGLEYACQNQRIYTIPALYCKPHVPPRINEDGTVNETG